MSYRRRTKEWLEAHPKKAKEWLEAHPKKAKVKEFHVYQEGSNGLWLCTLKSTEGSCCLHKITLDPLCREVPEDELSRFKPYTGKEETLTKEGQGLFYVNSKRNS